MKIRRHAGCCASLFFSQDAPFNHNAATYWLIAPGSHTTIWQYELSFNAIMGYVPAFHFYPLRLMNKLLLVSAFLLLAAGFSACKKGATAELEGDWLFPIAKGDLSINSLNSLKNLEYHIQIPAQSISQPVNIPVSSPGLQLQHVGPFPVQITDWLHRLDVDTLEFSGNLNNFFPVPIGAGTKVVMRTSADTSGTTNIAGTANIPATVLPGGLFSFDIKVLNKQLGDSVFFFLEEFNSPPYNNVVFSTTATQLNITLKVITASYAAIYTNKTFSSIDTTEFSAGSDDQLGVHTSGTLSDTATSGNINVFADNGLPANTIVQLYFLNSTKTQILDSLFVPESFTIAGGRTDGAGNATYVAPNSTKVPISRRKLDNIKQAAYVISNFRFNTIGFTGPYVSINRKPALTIQLTGDLKLNIRF